MTEEHLLKLHQALHSNRPNILLEGKLYTFLVNNTGCRYTFIDEIKYIQQNPDKDTAYGWLAREGDKITWGIRPGRWDLIVNNEIKILDGVVK